MWNFPLFVTMWNVPRSTSYVTTVVFLLSSVTFSSSTGKSHPPLVRYLAIYLWHKIKKGIKRTTAKIDGSDRCPVKNVTYAFDNLVQFLRRFRSTERCPFSYKTVVLSIRIQRIFGIVWSHCSLCHECLYWDESSKHPVKHVKLLLSSSLFVEIMNEKKIYIACLKAYKCMLNLPRLTEN